jgi:hypothetical protein
MEVTMASKRMKKGITRKAENSALRAAAEKFIANAKTWKGIQDLTKNPRALIAAEKDPAAFFSSREAKLPRGLELELFQHPSKVLPPPDWFPFVIEFYNCRTYYIQKCDNSAPPLCEWTDETICFGIRIRPVFLPPIA